MLSLISSPNLAVLLRTPSRLFPLKFPPHQWQPVVEILSYIVLFLLSLGRGCDSWKDDIFGEESFLCFFEANRLFVVLLRLPEIQ